MTRFEMYRLAGRGLRYKVYVTIEWALVVCLVLAVVAYWHDFRGTVP